MVALPPMRVLAVDTSTDHTGVVLWQDGSSAARLEGQETARHAEILVGLIDRAFSLAGWRKGQLDLIACCVGPGSFTGLRVGLATAKGIALALDRPICGIGSLEAMARALPTSEGQIVFPLLEARVSELFWAAYDGDRVVEGPCHVARAQIAPVLARYASRAPVGWAGRLRRTTIVGAAAAGLDLQGFRIVRSPVTDRPDPAMIAQLAADKLASRASDELHTLEPLYVRPPDITMPHT
jgi:tRNA threonylcarbamoyladenosine biosynthesis protein TsaB